MSDNAPKPILTYEYVKVKMWAAGLAVFFSLGFILREGIISIFGNTLVSDIIQVVAGLFAGYTAYKVAMKIKKNWEDRIEANRRYYEENGE